MAEGHEGKYRKLTHTVYFWARGYFVNTVGVSEDLIRRYVRYQEEEEKKRERQRSGYDLFS